MPFPHTFTADPGIALVAFSILSAISLLYSFGFDPLPAPLLRAVDTIPRRILSELAVPRDLEFVVEEVLHIFDGNGIRSATSWWHLRRVLDGEPEVAFHTRMTHTMSALEFGCFRQRKIFTAGDALDADFP